MKQWENPHTFVGSPAKFIGLNIKEAFSAGLRPAGVFSGKFYGVHRKPLQIKPISCIIPWIFFFELRKMT